MATKSKSDSELSTDGRPVTVTDPDGKEHKGELVEMRSFELGTAVVSVGSDTHLAEEGEGEGWRWRAAE